MFEQEQERQERIKKENKKIAKIIGTVIISIFAIILFFGSFYTIDAGYKGVLLTFGKAKMITIDEGLHIKWPMAQKVVKYEVRTMKYEAKAGAASKDLQIVSTELAVNYRVISEVVPILHNTIGENYEGRIIQPMVQEVVKSVTAQYNAEELIQKRDEVQAKVITELIDGLQTRHLIVEEVSMTDFDFSAEFNAAIEAKVKAEVRAAEAVNDLTRISTEAEQAVATANGRAESIKLEADAKAYQTEALADADAYALRVVRQELEKSKDLLQYEAIQKWTGAVPQYMGMGEAVPFVDVALN